MRLVKPFNKIQGHAACVSEPGGMCKSVGINKYVPKCRSENIGLLLNDLRQRFKPQETRHGHQS